MRRRWARRTWRGVQAPPSPSRAPADALDGAAEEATQAAAAPGPRRLVVPGVPRAEGRASSREAATLPDGHLRRGTPRTASGSPCCAPQPPEWAGARGLRLRRHLVCPGCREAPLPGHPATSLSGTPPVRGTPGGAITHGTRRPGTGQAARRHVRGKGGMGGERSSGSSHPPWPSSSLPISPCAVRSPAALAGCLNTVPPWPSPSIL